MVELTALQRERVRRSQRVSAALSVTVTSLDPANPYSEQCMTFVVNAHGAGLRAPRPIGPQTPVQVEVGSAKRTATAHVVMCSAIRGTKDLWELGIELDTPSNIWGFHFPPPDWIQPLQTAAQENPSEESPAAQTVAAPVPHPAPSFSPQTSEAAPQIVADSQPPAIPSLPASPATLSPSAVSVPAPAAQASMVAETKEVSFSLAELQAEVPPQAAATPPPEEAHAGAGKTEMAPPLELAKPAIPADFERDLRESARRISAEFEENYRRSLGELLARLRADLEGQATDDWNRVLRRAEEQLQAIAVEQTSSLQQERVRQEEARAQLTTKLEELNKLRDYLESLLRAAPQTLQQHLQEGAAAAQAEARSRLEQELAAAAETQAKQLEGRIQAVLAEAAHDARQALLDDFDRHEREFLDRIAVRLEEVRASADHTREFTKRATTDIARQSEQLRVDLRTQFDSLFDQQRKHLASKLEDRHEQLSQAAHTALENLGDRLWGSLRQQLIADFAARARELQQSLQTAQAETRGLRERTETLAARLDEKLEAHLDQAVEDAASRAQDQLQQQVSETQQEARRQIEIEWEQSRARREQADQALAESLRAQREALLAEVKRDSQAIAADCLAQYQTAMQETLESIEGILRDKLRMPRGES